jgi:hypothetical protein
MATATAAPKWKAILEPTPLVGPPAMLASIALALVGKGVSEIAAHPEVDCPSWTTFNTIGPALAARLTRDGCQGVTNTANSVSFSIEGKTATITFAAS